MTCDKIGYQTIAEAKAAIRQMMRFRKGIKLHPYKCRDCPYYHLTHRKTDKLEKPAKKPKYPFKFLPLKPVELIKKKK